MVNEESIKLMTRMAAYEDNEHRKHKKIIGFFKSDYLSLQLMNSFIAGTLSFAILFSLYILYDFELFMKEIYQMDLFGFIRTVIIIYVIYMAVIFICTYVYGLVQYNRALQSSKLYFSNLRKMEQIYKKENKGNIHD